MIVCKQCGYQNEEGDTFCGSCGAFLEWVGEKVAEEEPEPEPVPEPVVEEAKVGFVTRVKHALGVDEHEATPTAPEAEAPAPAVDERRPSEPAPLPPPPTATDLTPPGGAPLAPPRPAGGTLPPPPGVPVDAEAARAKAEAERKAAEEAERRRKEEEARRKAALLVAKPKVTEPATPTAPTTPVKGQAKGKAAESVAATAGVAATDAAITERQPGAQKPGAPVHRPKVAKQPSTRVIRPGDLVCGECGEGNDPGRSFCRRCGASLAEVVPVKQPGWFKRLFTRKPKQPLEAGARPMREGGGSGGSSAGKKARQAKGKALGGLASARSLLALLAVVGIGVGFLLPRPRSFILGLPQRVTNLISPSYVNARPNPEATQATSETPGFEAKNVFLDERPPWLPLESDLEPAVAAVFDETTSIAKVQIQPGNQLDDGKQFPVNPRPRDMLIQAFGEEPNGEPLAEKQVRLEDDPKLQTFGLSAKGVKSVRFQIQNCYQADANPAHCAITFLVVLKKKT
jgi:hypothetical protein